MEPDDLLPNDATFLGGVPREPASQEIERKKEKAQTLEALPILQDLIARLDERIKFYEKTTSIDDEVRDDPVKFMHIHNSYSLTAQTLQSEKEYIKGLVEVHAKQ